MILVLFFSQATAQNLTDPNQKNRNLPSLGFTVNQLHRDFGMGSCITSPYFMGKTFAVRFNYSRNWYEHPGATGIYTWSDYQNVRLGIVGVGGVILNHVRLYGEGGVGRFFGLGLLSERGSSPSGYGLIGFEFLFKESRNGSYFIELGGCGTGLRADKLSGRPFIGQGFMFVTGFRI